MYLTVDSSANGFTFVFGDADPDLSANFPRARCCVLMNSLSCSFSFFHAKTNCHRNIGDANAFSASLSPFSVATFFALKIAVCLYLV